MGSYDLNTFSGRLKYVRKEIAKKGQIPFAKSIGVSQQAISQWENGDIAEPKHAYKISREYSISIDWLLSGEGSIVINTSQHAVPEMSPINQISIIGEVQAGTWREARQWEQEDWQTEFFNASANEANAFGLRVSGDSMDDYYPEGSTVIVLPINDYPVQIENGDHVIVERSRGGDIYELTIKELVINGDKAELWPRSRNPKFKEPVC